MQENPELPTEESATEEITPHLTEQELEQFHKISRRKNKQINSHEWYRFLNMQRKGKRFNKPLMITEDGTITERVNQIPAPISQGNLRKGTLRNKKCSCGSGKKFKFCCLRNYGV